MSTTRSQHRVLALAATVAFAMVSCATGTPQNDAESVPAPPPATTSETATPAAPTAPEPTPPAEAPEPAEPSPSGENLALKRAFSYGGYGYDGDPPPCSQVADADRPDVWIETGRGVGQPAGYEGFPTVRLCLYGFSSDLPISLQVGTAQQTYTTALQPANAVSAGIDQGLSRHTLFQDGSQIEVYPETPDYLHSQPWSFAPASEIRDEIATTGEVTLTARQGGETTATRTVGVVVGSEPTVGRISGPVDDGTLLVIGLDEGQRVPIGLYQGNTTSGMTLVREVGTVVMPASRVAEFTPPADLPTSTPGTDYCLVPAFPDPRGEHCWVGLL